MTPAATLAAGDISPHHDLGESNDMPNQTYDAVKA
jgi:hypothetical protein